MLEREIVETRETMKNSLSTNTETFIEEQVIFFPSLYASKSLDFDRSIYFTIIRFDQNQSHFWLFIRASRSKSFDRFDCIEI